MKSFTKKYIILIALGMLCCYRSLAAFSFRSFPPLLLSPSENAFCMMFDHRGVLWIGTNNGLKSYDGYPTTPCARSPKIKTTDSGWAHATDCYALTCARERSPPFICPVKINASSIRSMSTRKDSCGWAPTADCRCLTGRRSDFSPTRARTHGSSHQRGQGRG